jgi:hypothetical protein
MEESEYMKLAESVPADWYTSEESLEVTKSIFYDIMLAYAMKQNLTINNDQDLQDLLEVIANEKEIPQDEVILNIQNVATTVGAVRLFNMKFPEIKKKFPKDGINVPIYPPKFLAKILEITEEIAIELQNGVLKDYAEYLVPDQV